jgi:integrase
LRLPALQKYVNKRVQEKGRRGRRVCGTTVKKEITTLSAAWNWALNAELVQRPFPRPGLKYPKSSEKLVFHTLSEVERKIVTGRFNEDAQAALWDSVFLSVAEIDELLRTVKQRDTYGLVYSMMAFAAHTGARRSEIRRCTVDDVDLDGGVLTIHERKRVRGLLTTRRVPLSPFLSEVLKHWLSSHRGCGTLFYAEGESRANQADGFTPKGIVYQFRTAVAGTRFEHLRGWHVFRHSFCSNCTAKGIDQRILDSWVGHQTPEMARRYRHLVPDQQREAIGLVFGTNAFAC